MTHRDAIIAYAQLHYGDPAAFHESVCAYFSIREEDIAPVPAPEDALRDALREARDALAESNDVQGALGKLEQAAGAFLTHVMTEDEDTALANEFDWLVRALANTTPADELPDDVVRRALTLSRQADRVRAENPNAPVANRIGRFMRAHKLPTRWRPQA